MKDFYLPEHFRGTEAESIVDLYPLATVLTTTAEGLVVSHLPLLREGEVLVGHLARANPQAASLDSAKVLAIFHGPQAYVSPLWYESCDVPTWNYQVVHAHGRARLLGEEESEKALRLLSARMEGPEGWKFGIPLDLAQNLHRVIVGFEIRVERWEAKDKLGQNRSMADRVGVIKGLRKQGERSQQVADAMERAMSRKNSGFPAP